MVPEELNADRIKTMAEEYPVDQEAQDAQCPPQAAMNYSITEAHRRINTPNLVLVGLFIAGIACLYLLSLRAGPASASAEEKKAEAKVDAAISHLSAIPKADELAKETAEIIDTFYYEAAQRQIPLDRLRNNPFDFDPASEKPQISEATGPTENPAGLEVYQRESDAMAAVGKLQLQSVLSGAGGATAMISNNMLMEGQVINGWTVASIESREVVLTWKDKQYVLSMPR